MREIDHGWYDRRYLPHVGSGEVVQSVTYRLGDSLPPAALAQIQEQAELFPEHQRARELRRRIDDYVDRGHGRAVLAQQAVASLLIDNWRHFDGKRYDLLAFVVMPNHVHVLISIYAKQSLPGIVHSWKSYTAHRILAMEGVDKPADGRLWQREFWDRYIRNEEHFWRVINYIHDNPVKARLCARPEDWPWSSARDCTP